MRTRPSARLAALVAVAFIVAGCSAANGDASSPRPPLQLRIVTSSQEGPCNVPPLTSDGPGSACGRAGTTTYELDESLGVVTPTSVTRDGSGTGQTVVVAFDEADAAKLSSISSEALDKQLAILLAGKVLSAATVKASIGAGPVKFAFGSAAEAEQVAAVLGASTTR